MLQAGDKAPEFSLASDGGSEIGLRDSLTGVDYLIVAFYPKDNTSG